MEYEPQGPVKGHNVWMMQGRLIQWPKMKCAFLIPLSPLFWIMAPSYVYIFSLFHSFYLILGRHTHTCMEKFEFLLVSLSWCSVVSLRGNQVLYKALIILFKVTGIGDVTILSTVHSSLDVHTRSILTHINSLITPLLIKEKHSIQGGIEVYEWTTILPQETDIVGNLLLNDCC